MLSNRARYYNPGSGRFLSEDPIGFDSGDYNEYRYVLNNALFYKDYSGKGPIAYAFCLGVTYTAAFAIAVPEIARLSDKISQNEQQLANKTSLRNDLIAENQSCTDQARYYSNLNFINDLNNDISAINSEISLDTASLGAILFSIGGGTVGLTKACKAALLIPGP